jgi:hypothetical protein
LKLKVRTNEAEIFADLDALAREVEQTVKPRAANKLRDQALTAGSRAIARIYGLPVRQVSGSRYVRLILATASNPQGGIIMGGPGFPLSLFSPRKEGKRGISVQVKGKRFLIPGAFLATMKSGHLIVGARGAYGGKSSRIIRRTGSFGRFIFGRGERVKRANKWGSSELPVNEFLTFSLGDALANREVVQAMQDRIEEQAEKVIAQELRFILSRG